MRSVNRVTLIGNVGSDPEVRTTGSGTKLAKVSLATSEQWKRDDGQDQKRTDWHRLTFWGKLADVVEEYVVKGDRLYVEGSVRYSTSERDDGTTTYWTEINVKELVMLGAGPGGREPAGAGASRRGRDQGPDLSGPDDSLPF